MMTNSSGLEESGIAVGEGFEFYLFKALFLVMRPREAGIFWIL